jgi:hypothetical protein
MIHGRARPPPACGESATYSLFTRRRHACRHSRWHACARPALRENFIAPAIAEFHGSNVYFKDDRSIGTGRLGESLRPQAELRLSTADVAITQQPLPDEVIAFSSLAA